MHAYACPLSWSHTAFAQRNTGTRSHAHTCIRPQTHRGAYELAHAGFHAGTLALGTEGSFFSPLLLILSDSSLIPDWRVTLPRGKSRRFSATASAPSRTRPMRPAPALLPNTSTQSQAAVRVMVPGRPADGSLRRKGGCAERPSLALRLPFPGPQTNRARAVLGRAVGGCALAQGGERLSQLHSQIRE